MNKFFISSEKIGGNAAFLDKKEDVDHLRKVLRLHKGDKIEISDSMEWDYICAIDEICEDSVTLQILDKQKFAGEPAVSVTLFQGIPKLSKMDTVIQKSVELGVATVVPVFTDRTVVTDKRDNLAKKIARWQKISDEAAKQSKRGRLPSVCEPCDFKAMLARVESDYDLVLFLYENEKAYTIRDELKMFVSKYEWKLKKIPEIALMVGPEGGFSDDEAGAIRSLGIESVTLGARILRTETAAMAALSMILYETEL